MQIIVSLQLKKTIKMHTFHIITQGILFGLTLSFMVGPAFFKLIQTSISKGFKYSSHLAMGISLSDIIMVFLAWYGLSNIFETPKTRQIFSIVGGAIIICFGIYTATRKHITHTNPIINKGSNFHLKYMAQGFIFNIANPGTWLFWLIPIGMAGAYNKQSEQIIFLASILSTNLAMDLVKCAISNELKKFLTDNVITIINKIVGCILVFFGIYLALSSFLWKEANLINNF